MNDYKPTPEQCDAEIRFQRIMRIGEREFDWLVHRLGIDGVPDPIWYMTQCDETDELLEELN